MPKPTLRKRVARVALAVAALYFLALMVVWFGQRHFLYFPSRVSLQLATAAARSGFTTWEGPTGDVIGWKHLCQTTRV